jgi:putative ABC transport system ATP-binding protein/macrolide transport system ATP-binding/permease protein/lipoprotein-releasing system ATP-binding protein
MLTADKLTKRYSGDQPVDAVDAFQLTLERGKFLAIVGRSGSGKSSLLAMLGGISRPTSGTVLIDGTDQWRLSDNAHCDFRNENIGFVFQFASLLPTLRAIDNVALPALVSGSLEKQQAYSRARMLLERVGLCNRYSAYPNQLSGGEQRRVAIARALINSPSLLLADEPTADLDEETEEEILGLLIDIQRTLSLTLVVVTHNPEIARRADHLITMRAGRAVSSEDQSVMRRSATAENADRVKEIFGAQGEAAKQTVSIGVGFERFVGRLVLYVVPMFLLAFGINAAISAYQNSVIEAKAAEQQALQTLGMNGLSSDVKAVSYGPGKSYLLSLTLNNTADGKSVYVMSPSVRVFVQVGTSWQEVPLKPVSVPAQKVFKLEGEQILQYSIEPNVKDFEQLIPYYMHVRISNDMLISPSSQPKTDLYERNDNYYVYLKPHGADDAAILNKSKFPGKPPVWIAMPPH